MVLELECLLLEEEKYWPDVVKEEEKYCQHRDDEIHLCGFF